jgi:hypothetical protein
MSLNPFIVPGTPRTSATPASSSRAPSIASFASETSSEALNPEKFNIWTLFRLARGSEKQKLAVRLPSGKVHNKTLHYCLLCEQKTVPESWSDAYTGNAREHIQKRHQAQWREIWRGYTGSIASVDDPAQRTIERYTQRLPDHKSRTIILREAYDRPRHIRALIALCSKKRIALSASDWPELHELMLASNPAIEDLIRLSRRTLVRLLSKNHLQYRKQLQNSLHDSKSKIHLSTDMWSSPARRGHLAICVQWVDEAYKLRKALLGLPQVKYSHSGEAQATQILQSVESYGITTRIGWHTGDNATSNDTLLRELSSQLEAKHQVRTIMISLD